jgi:hypothetical protein
MADVLRKCVKSISVAAPKKLRIPLTVSVIALVGAVNGDWQSDYFVLLQATIFITCVIAMVLIWRVDRLSTWLGVIFTLAVIYNPLLPLHLHRTTWGWINVLSIPPLAFLILAVKEDPHVSRS